MAIVRLEIDIGKGVRDIIIDPDALTLGWLEDIEEAQTTKQWRPMISALGQMIGLTHEETRAITMTQFRQITAAMNEAAAIPNGNGESSTAP